MIRTAIVNKLHNLSEDPDNPDLDITVLKGGNGFRLRVGKYRVVYTRHDDILLIEIVYIRSRGDVGSASGRHPFDKVRH